MFTNAITDLPLTDETASELFSNINADSFESDVTFCATLRYLLFEKLEPCESINVKLSIDKTHRAGFYIPFLLEKDIINICVLKGHSLQSFEKSKADPNLNLDMFVFQDQASYYLSRAGCKSYVYINENTKTTLVLMQNLTMKCWHKMQSSLTRLLPWYFPVPIDDAERAFLHTLTYKDSAEYLKYLTAYAKKFNFHEDRLKRLLNNFGLSYEKMRLDFLMKDQATNKEDFNRAQDEIMQCIKKDRDLQTAIMGIEELLAKGDDTGLADYFICNKYLHLISVKNEELSYVVMTYLDYFDQAVFEKIFMNRRSYFFTEQIGVAENQDDYKKLLCALFGDDPCLKIRVCAEFKLSLSGTLDGIENSTKLSSYPDWLPHPHIDSTNCLGTNARYINDMMMDKRYIEAIEQTVAATKNINFGDSTVAKKLVIKLQTSKQRFIELPTGEAVTPEEAVRWIKMQEGS